MVPEAFAAARDLWSRIAALAYPLLGDREVVMRARAGAPPLEFCTDGRRITVGLNQPAQAEADFRRFVLPLYGAAANAAGATPGVELNLWIDTFLFALFHELYHPLVCPNSAADERAITWALYRGVRAATPGQPRLEHLRQAAALRNLVWDLVVNITFLARLGAEDNPLPARIAEVFARADRRCDQVPIRVLSAGAVPVLYYMAARAARTDLLIAIVGALYGLLAARDPALRDGLLQAFRAEAQRLGAPQRAEVLAVELAAAIVGSARAGPLLSLHPPQDEALCDLRARFEDPTERYRAVEAAGRFLAPFLRGPESQGSIDPRVRGRGGEAGGEPAGRDPDAGDAAGDTLEDVIEALPAGEADDLLREAAAAGGAGSFGPGGGGGGAGKAWGPLALAAADEYYRRHAEPLTFRSPDRRAIAFDLGRQRRWRLKNAQMLAAPDVTQLDPSQVLTFQATTGLPVLMNLAEGYWQLNEYRLEETPVRSYALQPCGVEIPDAWVLIVDSSGSMATAAYVGTGGKYDLLMRVCYGAARGLEAVARALHRDLKFGVVNFSNSTSFSGLCDFLPAFAARRNRVKETLLVPQCGGTELDLGVLAGVDRELPPGRALYTLVTDGEIGGDPDGTVAYLSQWAAQPGHALVFIEIGVESDFGKRLRAATGACPSVGAFRVNDVKEITATLGSILVRHAR